MILTAGPSVNIDLAWGVVLIVFGRGILLVGINGGKNPRKASIG